MSQDFRGRGRPWGIFFGFYKTRHILLSDSANCTVLRAVVLTQYRRATDGQTDGTAIGSTALAMRALRSAVTRMIALSCGIKNIAGRFFGLVTKHVCDRDRETDGRTELRLPRPR